MNKAIIGTGAAGSVAAGGMAALSLAFAGVAFGAAAVVAAIGAVVAGLVALGVAGVNTAASVESAFAGVLKVTTNLGNNLFDLTEIGEQVFQDFRDLAKEIPLTFEELAKIGAFGGQLGVADEQLADFTETIAALAVSTNLSLEDASLGLTRIGNIWGVEAENMALNTEKLGSAIVFLGNNFNVLEQDILLAARNIAGAGELIGLTQADILGIGSALIGVGVRAEAGGTAVSRAFIGINTAVIKGGTKLRIFAKTAGLTVREFKELWETDATEAFLQFVDGLAEEGDRAAIILDKVGLGSVRSLRTFLGLAAASEELREKVEAANTAFEENTALAREAEIRYATFDSQVQVLKNNIRDMGITIGLELIPRLLEVIEATKPVVDAIALGIGPAVEDVADAIEKKLLPALGNLFLAFGIELPGEGLFTPVDQMTAAVQGLGETIATHIENISMFVEEMARLIDLFKEEGLGAVIDDLTDQARGFGGEIETTGSKFEDVADAFETDGERIDSALENIGLLAEGAAGIIGSAFENVALPALEGIVGLAGNIIDLWASVLSLDFEGVKESLGGIADTLLEAVPEIFEGLALLGFDIVGAIFDIDPEVVKAAVSNFAANILNTLGALFDGLVETVRLFFAEALPQAIVGALLVAAEVFTAITEFAIGIDTAIREGIDVFFEQTLPTLIDGFKDAGKDMILGLLEGMQANVGRITQFLTNMINRLLNALLGPLGFDSDSPSRKTRKIGEDVMAGLALGIENMAFAPQVALTRATDRTVSMATQTLPTSVSNVSSTDRSFTVGDLNMTTQPESPASIGLILQQIALLQAGA